MVVAFRNVGLFLFLHSLLPLVLHCSLGAVHQGEQVLVVLVLHWLARVGLHSVEDVDVFLEAVVHFAARWHLAFRVVLGLLPLRVALVDPPHLGHIRLHSGRCTVTRLWLPSAWQRCRK